MVKTTNIYLIDGKKVNFMAKLHSGGKKDFEKKKKEIVDTLKEKHGLGFKFQCHKQDGICYLIIKNKGHKGPHKKDCGCKK